MTLYHDAADVLTAAAKGGRGGSLKARIFNPPTENGMTRERAGSQSGNGNSNGGKGREREKGRVQPVQIYALVLETSKWSAVLKEVVENADLLRVESKLTPILALLLVHDLLLARRGIALPATHGLRKTIERHKNRLQAELTKARVRRGLGSLEALRAHVEMAALAGSGPDQNGVVVGPYPRWIRVNTLKTTLEDQLESTFDGYARAASVSEVRVGAAASRKMLYIDETVPNLVAVTPGAELSRCTAYKAGDLIFQDKASCFPAYLLDPLPQDGDLIDSCAAPGNKTTHLAAILVSHSADPDEPQQTIHAFEKDKARAETLEKMVNLAGSAAYTKLHKAADFLRSNPNDPAYKNVGALLLDPSCSGSGIVGRDEVPPLHLPGIKEVPTRPGKNAKKNEKPADAERTDSKKRKRGEEDADAGASKPDALDLMVDDDGIVTAVGTDQELQTRLDALSAFQLELLLHAFQFPAARKITYSTCSIYAAENEHVVRKALASDVARQRGWHILPRHDQVRGLRDWPVRGSPLACDDPPLLDACIRASLDDDHATMGFFLAAFVRSPHTVPDDVEALFLRDDRGHIVRDLMGIPIMAEQADQAARSLADHEMTGEDIQEEPAVGTIRQEPEDEAEWGGFDDPEPAHEQDAPKAPHPHTQANPKPNPKRQLDGKHGPGRPAFSMITNKAQTRGKAKKKRKL